MEVCGAAKKGGVSLYHNLILALLPELVFAEPSNQPVQETDPATKQKIINIQLNQLSD